MGYLDQFGDGMKNKWISWCFVLVWCGMIYYFTESPLFTGAHTAEWIREIMHQLGIGHAHHVDDGMFSWNYLIRKLAHLSVFGLLAVLAWRALYPRRWLACGCLSLFTRVWMNGINRFSQGGRRFCQMSSSMRAGQP